MSLAWLSLGANIGDPPAQILTALTQLQDHPHIQISAQSALIQTPPWGKTDQPDFHNLVVEIATSLSPMELLDACQKIENNMGRIRKEKWGPRLIDIDIVAYERQQMTSDRLTLPHLHAHERDFVMHPLREVSPKTADWIIKVAKT